MLLLVFLQPVKDLFLAPAVWGASWLFQVIAPYGIGDTWRILGG
jgi:hypothetical protein